MLTLIGLGLADPTDITLKGLEALRKADVVYLEHYTAVISSIKKLEEIYERPIHIATRCDVESDTNEILTTAKTKNVALLIVGDVFSATTHTDLFLRAKQQGIAVCVIYNASIMTAIGVTGLQLYKFGKTTSLVFFDKEWKPQTAYDVIKQNKSLGLHTLVLLDIKVAEPSRENLARGVTTPMQSRFMTVNQAISQLLLIEKERDEGVFVDNTVCVGVARIGGDSFIKAGTASALLSVNFGEPMHSLIVPGALHFHEEEVLELYR